MFILKKERQKQDEIGCFQIICLKLQVFKTITKEFGF